MIEENVKIGGAGTRQIQIGAMFVLRHRLPPNKIRANTRRASVGPAEKSRSRSAPERLQRRQQRPQEDLNTGDPVNSEASRTRW